MKTIIYAAVVLILTFSPKDGKALNYDSQEPQYHGRNCEIASRGEMVYWCPTNNGNEWTRVEILGMDVISIKRFKTLFMEEDHTREVPFTRANQTSGNMERLSEVANVTRTTNEMKRTNEGVATTEMEVADDVEVAIRQVVYSNGGACFHTASECANGRAIYNANSITFSSEKDAREAGLKKCRRCLFIEKMRMEEL